MGSIWIVSQVLSNLQFISNSNSHLVRYMLVEDKLWDKVKVSMEIVRWWTVSTTEEILHLMKMLVQCNSSYKISLVFKSKSSNTSNNNNTNCNNNSLDNKTQVQWVVLKEIKTNNHNLLLWTISKSKISCWTQTKLLKYVQHFKPLDGDLLKQEERRLWNKWSILTWSMICLIVRRRKTLKREGSLTNYCIKVTEECLSIPWHLSMLWVMSVWEEAISYRREILLSHL